MREPRNPQTEHSTDLREAPPQLGRRLAGRPRPGTAAVMSGKANLRAAYPVSPPSLPGSAARNDASLVPRASNPSFLLRFFLWKATVSGEM